MTEFEMILNSIERQVLKAQRSGEYKSLTGEMLELRLATLNLKREIDKTLLFKWLKILDNYLLNLINRVIKKKLEKKTNQNNEQKT